MQYTTSERAEVSRANSHSRHGQPYKFAIQIEAQEAIPRGTSLTCNAQLQKRDTRTATPDMGSTTSSLSTQRRRKPYIEVLLHEVMMNACHVVRHENADVLAHHLLPRPAEQTLWWVEGTRFREIRRGQKDGDPQSLHTEKAKGLAICKTDTR